MGFQQYIALTILVSCILSIWPSHPSLCALIKFVMFLRFIILSNSWLVFIRQIPFSLVGPNIFVKTYLSKTISLLVVVSFSVHVSHAYVTIGLISEQYNFNFAILDISLLWNIFLFAKKALFRRVILSFISSSIVLSVLTVETQKIIVKIWRDKYLCDLLEHLWSDVRHWHKYPVTLSYAESLLDSRAVASRHTDRQLTAGTRCEH